MEYYNQLFESSEMPINSWIGQTFEQCTFRKLSLSDEVFFNSNFINCRFEGCDLSRVELKNTQLQDVLFTHCKLMYVDFGVCNAFSFHADFQHCQLDNAVFLNRRLKKAQFIECSLKEAHILKCDLAGAKFKECNLELTRFEDNNLMQADFSTSYNLELNPDTNKIKKAKFSLHNLPGLLTKHDLVISR